MTTRSKHISTLALVCILTIAAAWVPLPALADAGDALVSTAAVRLSSEIRVGLVRTQTAAGARDYLSGAYLNTIYDHRVEVVRSFLTAEGFAVGTVDDAALASLEALERYDVLVLPVALATTSAQRGALRAFAARGGGIVAMFGLSRWDAKSTYTYGYLPFLGMQNAPGVYTWPPSTLALKPWEWGEISEIYNTTFVNDPLMYGGYRLEQASTHWIMSQTAAEAGSTLMVDKPNRYNEIMDTMPAARNVTMLYRYNTLTNGSTADNAVSGYLASWASEYYFGRLVYFGFHLHDLLNEGVAADAATVRVARRVLANSVRWAASSETYVWVRKAVELSGRAWYTRGTLYIDETVLNVGTTSLRGPLKVDVTDPSGSLVYSGQAYSNLCPVPPGGSYTHKSYTVPLSRPAVGTWTITMTYRYFDHFRGGDVTASRRMQIDSTGSAMGPSRLLVPAPLVGNAPVIGTRLAGTSRYETAVSLSQRGWPKGAGEYGAVVLATGGNYPDALAAAPLAGRFDAPMLLVPPTGLSPTVSQELVRLFSGHTRAQVFIVGGTGAVSEQSEAQVAAVLEGAGVLDVDIERLAGADRFQTASMIARRAGAPEQGAFEGTAFVVSGENYPDALAVGALAAAEGVPILPVLSTEVPASVQDALDELDIEHCVIVGGTTAVGTAVESWLETNGYRVPGVADNVLNVDSRLAGASRYETALLAGQLATRLGDFDPDEVFFATGDNWPDALALAPMAGTERHALVLIAGDEIGRSTAVANYLVSRQSAPPECTFIGGPAAISDYVRGQVRTAFRL
ncbi:MAG TPA: cell wall-binding repeat-containing protein [Coriobacteriia bacterium]|nr:cell wall-binding repeat-containing protein [Coriobacteriia bacterium]